MVPPRPALTVLSYALAGSVGRINANLIREIPITLIQRAEVRHPAPCRRVLLIGCPRAPNRLATHGAQAFRG